MRKQWTADKILELARSYQPACVLAAAADLDIFGALAPAPRTAEAVARKLRCDPRGMRVLLDVLVALRFLDKRADRYFVPRSVAALLTESAARNVLAMVRHQANCLRRWAQLATAVKMGRPAPRLSSVRGEAADCEAFIGAMHNVSAPRADKLIRELKPLRFRHLLDVGGASGTWTIAFLRANRSATATLFDLPRVMPLADRRLARAGLRERTQLVAGDFLADPLPRGADLVWVSAIVHQNSREQNRKLFAKVFRSLDGGGRIAIRDILMDQTRTAPVAGALFAVNMLVGTKGGGTFTFDELREDLEAAGFVGARVRRRDAGMNSVIMAQKPARA